MVGGDDMTWERLEAQGNAAVDREKNVIHGFVVAQEGRFKSKGRGQFDQRALQSIVDIGNAAKGGLKSRLAHPTLSADGIGKLVGHARNFRMDQATTFAGKSVRAVRADLHISPTSFKTPNGNIGGYVMDLAEKHPESFSSSLVLQAKKEQALDAEGRPAKDEDGTPHPPLWRPTELHASDIVDTGDAVDGFLSAGHGLESLSIAGLPDEFARIAAAALAENFPDMDRAALRAKVHEWLESYLTFRFGEEKPKVNYRALRLKEIESWERELGIDNAA